MNKKKIYIIASVCLLCIMALVGTVAYYSRVLFTDLTVDTIVHNLDYYINYTEGQNISAAELTSSADYTGGVNTSVELWKKDDTYDIYGHIYLDINEIGVNASKASALKYAVVNNGSLIDSGSLKGTANGDSIILTGNIPLSTTKQLYTVYIWIDQDLIIDESMESESLSLTVRCEATMKEISILKGASLYITNLYTKAEKTTVTNNSITYNYANIYDTDDDSATSGGLMNDRLGGITSDYNAGNIRYYGASPNNYIYFNCNDYSNQSAKTCELWRIIGVFDGKVKIIRNDSIGKFSWDNKDTTTGAESNRGKNDWTKARLMKLLNPSEYFTVDTNDNGLGQSLYYTAQSGTCYSGQNNATKSCNFTTTGIKNDTTRNMIEEVTWNLGGWNKNEVYPNQIYSYERGTTVYYGRPTSWTGKIALAYPSDYGYAADFSSCSMQLGSYNASTCTSVNWMKKMIGGYSSWLLTPVLPGFVDGAWSEQSSGHLYGYYAYFAYYVRPVLYLNSELGIESGDGSTSSPYMLSVR